MLALPTRGLCASWRCNSGVFDSATKRVKLTALSSISDAIIGILYNLAEAELAMAALDGSFCSVMNLTAAAVSSNSTFSACGRLLAR